MEETYTLRKGTTLYRGDTPYYLENKETLTPLQNKPTFFALNPDDVAQYGIIYGWEVTEDIVLPLIDNPAVMAEMYDGAEKDVQKVMRENYGFNPETQTIGDRNSIFEKDIIFYTYLCRKGYPGYASNDLEEGRRFSYEIMICDTTGYTCKGVFLPTDVRDKNLYISNQIQKYRERIHKREEPIKKKRRVLRFESPPKSIFDSPVKGKSMFDSPGGSTRKRRRANRKNKKTRSKK
jgi:hypothetical protein